jgi:hypothetical protein
MHVILKPAGVLLLVGSVATLSALALIRPVKTNVEMLPETKPIEGFATRKDRTSTFNSKTQMHPVNLTQEGKVDWVCWRSDASHAVVRRKSGGRLFSELKLLSGEAPSLEKAKAGPSRAFLWSDGDSPMPSSVAYPGFHTEGDGGFNFSVDVDAAPHTLTVYVGGYQAGGDFTATLTDGTKATVTNTEIALGEGYYSRAYTVQFRAGSPGQKVRVVWKKSRGNGNVSLQAATLS